MSKEMAVEITTVWNFLGEIDRAAQDKSRTAGNINDKEVKEIVNAAAEDAIISDSIGRVWENVVSVDHFINDKEMKETVNAAAEPAIISDSIGTIGRLLENVFEEIVNASAEDAIKSDSFSGATAYETAAHVVSVDHFMAVAPIAAPVIVAGISVFSGFLMGWYKAEKNKNEKERLNQEIMAKQNGIIKQLMEELEEIKKEHNRTRQQNERLKYITGLLMGFKDMENLCAA